MYVVLFDCLRLDICDSLNGKLDVRGHLKLSPCIKPFQLRAESLISGIGGLLSDIAYGSKSTMEMVLRSSPSRVTHKQGQNPISLFHQSCAIIQHLHPFLAACSFQRRKFLPIEWFMGEIGTIDLKVARAWIENVDFDTT